MENLKILIVLSLSICLTACPYKETYKYEGAAITEQEIEIAPSTFFFKERKDSVTGTLVFRITNKGDRERVFNFRNSYLFNNEDTVYISGIYLPLGQLNTLEKEMTLAPKKDTLIALGFVAKPNKFHTDINLFFSSNAIEDKIIKYNRIRQKKRGS